MRAYHRVDPFMDERKGHYSPAQLGAFVKVQLVAGRQKDHGYFRSVAALKAMLPGAYAKHVDFLMAEGDLVERGGRLYVDGWDEWQEGDLTVKDRMARLRNKQRNGRVSDAVTSDGNIAAPPIPPHTPPIPPRIGVDVGAGIEGAPVTDEEDPWAAPELPAISWLTQHGCYIPPVSGFYRQVVLGVEQFGVDAIVATFDRLAKAGVKKGDTKGFVFGALDALRGKPDLKVLEREQREEQANENFNRRVAKTQREMARVRGEA